MLSKREISQLKRAAEKIVLQKEQYACNAISKVHYRSPLRAKFIEIMSPDEDQMPYYQYTAGWYGFPSTPGAQMARSLALLFFAEAGKNGKE